MTYAERKTERVAHYKKYVEGWRSIPCTACNGSGHYDHNGSPKCGCCGGGGKEKVSPERYQRYLEMMERMK